MCIAHHDVLKHVYNMGWLKELISICISQILHTFYVERAPKIYTSDFFFKIQYIKLDVGAPPSAVLAFHRLSEAGGLPKFKASTQTHRANRVVYYNCADLLDLFFLSDEALYLWGLCRRLSG